MKTDFSVCLEDVGLSGDPKNVLFANLYQCAKFYVKNLKTELLAKNPAFYCATIAYHVGLNAVLGWPQGIRRTSKKNRHL